MTAIWQEAPCERPDPYLDWEYRTRPQHPRKQQEYWCSVHIQVIADSQGRYLRHLKKLQRAVKQGRLDDDVTAPPDILTIRMNDEERVALEKWIERLSKGGKVTDKVEMQFFIYRLEPLIYRNGEFRNTSFYTVISAGPPISGLTINEERNEKPQIVTFPPHPAAFRPVAIGIIDDGIAFAHERFRSGPETTRIRAIWLQQAERRRKLDKGILFGQLLESKAINKYLESGNSEAEIYRQVGLTEFGCNEYNPLAARAAHGTHVLDLAAGYDAPSGTTRLILAAQLPSVATIDTSGLTMGSYVLQAVRMLMSWADRIDNGKPAPLVINFSYGLLAGPKDGSHQLERALAELVNYRNSKGKASRTRLVLPSGNSYRARAAARMELKKSVPRDMDWVVLPDDGTANFLEIWLDGSVGDGRPSPVEISVTPPGDDSASAYRLEEGVMRQLTANDRPIAGMYYHVVEDTKGTRRGRILLAVAPSGRNDEGRDIAPAGRWKITIKNCIRQALPAHFYVQRDDTPFGYPRRGRQAYLDHEKAYEREKTGDYRGLDPECPITHEETLSAIATLPIGGNTIVVGAATASERCPPADYTASGPTISRNRPDCSAIADDGDAHLGVLAAGTLSGSVVAMRGTSIAAPQVARRVADALAGVTEGTTIPVAPRDEARLGKYVFIPSPNRKTPRRRYRPI